MFNLEKREKIILLILLATLLIGLAFGFYQKRAVRVDVRSGNLAYSAADPSTEGPSNGASGININEADTEELMKLKGVGKVLADRIIEYRSKNGSFISVEGLKKVKGLGGKLYDKIKDKVYAG